MYNLWDQGGLAEIIPIISGGAGQGEMDKKIIWNEVISVELLLPNP